MKLSARTKRTSPVLVRVMNPFARKMTTRFRFITASLFAALGFTLACIPASAQEMTPEPVKNGLDADKLAAEMSALHTALMARHRETDIGEIIVVTLSNEEANDISPATTPSSGRLKVGVTKSVDAKAKIGRNAPVAFGAVLENPQDRKPYWIARLHSPAAVGLRLELDCSHIPATADVYVYSAAAPDAFRVDCNRPGWTPTVAGDSIFLQIDGLPEDGETELEVRNMAHVGARDKLLANRARQAAHCSNNATCVENGDCFDTQDWSSIEFARSAAAHMLYQRGTGWYICSGGLINDSDADTHLRYFLTANHCLDTQASVDTLELAWNYRSACGSSCGDASYMPANGTLMATGSGSDFTLIRLNTAPPAGTWSLGWTTQAVSTSYGTQLFRISHPSGSPQAFSTTTVDSRFICSNRPRSSYIYSRNAIGATEGGSSGSPVMLADGKIVGQLYGVCGSDIDNTCNSGGYNQVDGAFAATFPSVRQWLQPEIQVVVSVTGSGTVSDGNLGISCNSECNYAIRAGSNIAFTVAPAAGWRFVGWSGSCAGSAPCTASIGSNTRVFNARFVNSGQIFNAILPLLLEDTDYTDIFENGFE